MSETIFDLDAPIGRRSVPLSGVAPLSGASWQGSRKFVIKQEKSGLYRWIMISGDHQHLQLAQSSSFLPSAQACEDEIRKFDPSSVITQDKG